ncbi:MULTISPECIES: class E sortase [unclassified Streptomyces]|uniref:class E sortase n=1 Tax=unclassified Streptomyces TaxID=2593676 RepID=UPI001F03FBF0|nr:MULTISPECIES: class E sortase [unclassified Streptomyces]MCH0566822.1 class E sortase [Streptomyces sp. MUM 2J]MCH0570246.1 class E sortase [Streptomyces sp. MUM 136J]
MRVIVRTLSELSLTAGTVMVLFVTYVLFWTGVRADDVMDDQIDTLRRHWALRGAQPAPSPRATAYPAGEAFAIMYIPRLGSTWNKPVLQGTDTGTLAKGLGHYPGTARLGQPGNFSVAGHRRTHGDPFKDFPRLRPGDSVVLTDGARWYTYRIDKGPYKTVPEDVAVIDPVPRASGYTRPGRYLTLTTCDPEWGHSHRLIVWAHLDSTKPVDTGQPEALRR